MKDNPMTTDNSQAETPSELIIEQLRRAIAGEPISDPTGAEWVRYMAAVRGLLNDDHPPRKDALLQAVGLVALSAMNHRLRAATVCAQATGRARLQ